MFVQLVIAAMTTLPCSSSKRSPSSSTGTEAGGARRHGDRGGELCRLVPGRDVRGRVAGRKRRRDRLVVRVLEPDPEAGQRGLEGGACLGQGHAILRPAGAGETRLHVAEVELDDLRVRRLVVWVVEEALRPGVRLDERDALGGPRGELEVAKRLGVDREEVAGGAALGRHVRDGGAVGQRQAGEAVAEELDELADDTQRAQLLRDREHEIGAGGAGRQAAGELEADDLRDEHRDRLTQHRRLGLDSPDTPAQHAEAVDHRRVRVRSDERVGEGLEPAVELARLDDPRKVLQVHLVDDARLRRHDVEAREGSLAPAQERVALAVALELELRVAREGEARPVLVYLHGVVDHELCREERVDEGGIAAERPHGISHRGQVDDGRHAR